MNNIRKWYSPEQRMDEGDNSTRVSQSVDKLLVLYYNGLMKYFGEREAANASHFVEIVKCFELSESDKVFLNWLEDKCFPNIKAILNANLQDEDSLLAMIEYDRFTLDEELNNYQCLSDLRSCLIAIGNEMKNWLSDDSKILEKYIFYDTCQEHKAYNILESALDADSFYYMERGVVW